MYRRKFINHLIYSSGLAINGLLKADLVCAGQTKTDQVITKPIPSTGESLPVVGMGTWITFNINNDIDLLNQRTEVLRQFFNFGGGMIDCSPMYGSSAETLGYCLKRLEDTNGLFSASKVWSLLTDTGPIQMEEQRKRWGVPKFDLMQIHNLLNWEGHLETLQADQTAGRIRYLGITTSHGRRHNELEKIMSKHDLDFVQVTYNIRDREVENRILPFAKERGIAVIANRPYRGGRLINSVKRNKLPDWVKREVGATTWAGFLLKFIVSHPAITCAIPATSNVIHMAENMRAGYGHLPDMKTRAKMIRFLEDL